MDNVYFSLRECPLHVAVHNSEAETRLTTFWMFELVDQRYL